MDIKFITQYYYKEVMGGSEYQTWLIAKGLWTRGYFTSVITLNNDRESREVVDNVPLIRIPMHGGMWNTDLLRKELSSPTDLVYIRHSFGEIDTAPLCKELNIPIIVGISSRALCSPFSWHRNPLNIARHWYHFNRLELAQAIISQTNEQKNLLLRYFRKNKILTVIPNGQPIPGNCVDFSDRSPTILWVGNLKPLKRPELFVELAKSLQNINAKFVMIGQPAEGRFGKKFEKCLQAAPTCFQYLGGLPHDAVLEMISQARLLVSTSIPIEGFPNVFIEAWMRGVPVVSLANDIDHIITENGVGRLSRSFDQMVKDVQELFTNPALCAEMGERAYQFSINNFDSEKLIGKYEDLFSEVIKRNT